MKRFTIILFCIILVIGILIIGLTNLVINKIIISQKIQPLLANKIQSLTGGKIEIDKIYFSFFRGLRIENLFISTPLIKFPLRISQININFSILPFLLRKEFVYNLESSPIEKLNMSFESAGVYSLRDKTLKSKIFLYNLSFSIIKLLYPNLPFKILEGKTDLEIHLELLTDGSLNILANIPVENFNLRVTNQTIMGDFLFTLNLKKIKNKIEIIEAILKPKKMLLALSPVKENIVLSQGEIISKEGCFIINDLNLIHRDVSYNIAGKITQLFTSPEGEIKISSKELTLEGLGNYTNRELNIKKISLTLPNSEVLLKGEIQNLRTGQGELFIEGKLDMNDLKKLPLEIFVPWERINVRALLEINAQLGGEIKKLNKITSFIRIKAKDLEIDKFKFEDLDMRIKTERGKLYADIKCNSYNGELVIDIKELSLKEPFPFLANLIIDEIDLKKLNEVSLKLGKDIAGIFHGELTCQGQFKKIKELKGEGWFEITNGLLWELPVLSKLGKIIEIPGIEKNVFREAHANFIIEKEAIATQDLELISKRLTLKTQGSVYLNGNLDLKVRAEFPQGEKPEGVLDQIQDMLLKGAGSLIKEVHIKGTVKNPEYKILPSIENIFQNISQ